MTKTVHADSEPLLLVVSVGGVCDLHIRLGFQAHLSRVEREEKSKGSNAEWLIIPKRVLKNLYYSVWSV